MSALTVPVRRLPASAPLRGREAPSPSLLGVLTLPLDLLRLAARLVLGVVKLFGALVLGAGLLLLGAGLLLLGGALVGPDASARR